MIKIIDDSDILDIYEDIFKDKYIISNNPYKKAYGFYIDNKIVGFIVCSLIYDRCELDYIGVIEEYRNMHVATKLINYLINENKKIKNITLEVNVNNNAAIKLYQSLGFEIVSIRKNYYKDSDAYLMERLSD